jgi:hypothetical protein
LTWQSPDTYHTAGIRLGTATSPQQARDNLIGRVGFVYEYAYSRVRTLLLTFKVMRREDSMSYRPATRHDTYSAIAWLYKLFGEPFVYDHHGLAPEIYQRSQSSFPSVAVGLRLRERLTYGTAERVIAANDSYRDVALTRGGKSAQDVVVVVVRSGPDPPSRCGRDGLDRAAQRTAPSLLLRRHHRPQDVSTWPWERHPSWFMRLAVMTAHSPYLGSADSHNEVRTLMHELGLDDYIVMPGFVLNDELVAYLSLDRRRGTASRAPQRVERRIHHGEDHGVVHGLRAARGGLRPQGDLNSRRVTPPSTSHPS